MDSTSDLIWLGTSHMVWLAVFSGVGLVALSLKALFGSFSIPHILREHTKKTNVDNTYEQMFKSRENYCYHIGSARSRGDLDDAKRLAFELQRLDADILQWEREHMGRR